MSLQRYWQKRDFSRTPEPRGKEARTGGPLRYVIQKHAARRLHYDFRLELDGTLKSWAVPKGPSLDPDEKRLAVQVEDHPLDYGDFEGVIPERQYGAGAVLLWDRGVWIPQGDPAAGYRRGRLTFRLEGDKLSGLWKLVRMHGRAKSDEDSGEDGKDNWLLIKLDDDSARQGKDAEITETHPESVASGRGIDEVASRRDRVWTSHKVAQQATASRRSPDAGRQLSKLPGAHKAVLPDQLSPQLASLTDRPPQGEDWLAEVKYDGYRMLCRIDDGQVRIFTRNGHDWTARLPRQAEAAAALPLKQAWLDGELVAAGGEAGHSFQLLQQAFDGTADAPLAFYLFDLPYLDGHDLGGVPLTERKRLLAALLADLPPDSPLRYSDHIQGGVDTVFEHACLHGLEGVIVKRADGGYRPGRGRDWLKLKCQRRQEFVIGGYSEPAGSRHGFGALLLGYYDGQGAFRYAGRVGTGFDDKTLTSLAAWLKQHERAKPAYAEPPTGREARDVHWVEPKRVVEVRFAEWTQEGVLRQAAFLGLRPDKAAREVVREAAVSARVPAEADTSTPRRKATRQPRRANGTVTLAGVTLTHPDKVLFPDIGLTKLDLARYYEQVADWVLPHLADRPLTLVRCPEGSEHPCFFQKHLKENIPDAIEQVEVPEDKGTATYMMINSRAALIGMVQMGVLELHTWGARADKLDKPDRLIFDLDPDPELDWPQVVQGVLLTRALLEEIGLTSFLKNTGGKGLHVVVPLHRRAGWDEAKAFSHALARHLAQTFPQLFTAQMAKAKRGGKIFIDYLRNAQGATAVAAYSTRARQGATVSTPLAWEELEQGVRANSFTVRNLAARLDRLGADPWAGYAQTRQTITGEMKRLFDVDES